MPRRRNRKDKRLNPTAAANGGGDLLSSLPEGILHHVLYFLPPHEAVRTSVLSRFWRDLWKSMTALRISNDGWWPSAADFNTFVNNLLLFRDRSPLREFEFYTYFHPQMQHADGYWDSDEVVRYIDMWIRHAFMCDVQVLKVIGMSLPKPMVLAYAPLIAKHLKTLQLWSVLLDGCSMDFSRCERLEDLMMDDCRISAHRMVSKSLRRLHVCFCDFPHDTRTRICVPILVSLHLDENRGMTPFLESMPLLDRGLVRLDPTMALNYLDGRQTCALLESLSNAAYLELVAESRMQVNVPLITKNLKTLQLWSVLLDGCSMDFSRCERLEDLMMDDCRISAHRMVSKSLRRLCICFCDFPHDTRTRICVPSLVSLHLDENRGMTPFLESMPLLDRGLVRLDPTMALNYLDGSQTCALLESLSNAAYLELVAESRVLVSVPLIAKNLKTLQLWSVLLDGCSMDFSRCERLEDLMMDVCRISAHRMVSKSLRHLRICYCNFSHHTRARICVPSLVSLQLDGNRGMTPFLESMPLLVTALVRLGPTMALKDLDGSQTCVLFESLSNATELELVAESGVTIFKQDLNWCPAFNKLKTLILSDWVLSHDIGTLKVILQHAPILEKLILQLSDVRYLYPIQDNVYENEMEESCSLVQQFPSEHLKVFEVRCRKDDEMVRKLEKMLKACGITSITFSLQEPDS